MSPWKFAAVSAAGTKHQKEVGECQDASRAFWDEETCCLFLIAADGAGYARHAGLAAEEVVKLLAKLGPKLLRESKGMLEDAQRLETYALELAKLARGKLLSLAEERSNKLTLNDFATTLNLVICTPSYLVGLQVGDGFTLAITDEPTLISIFEPSKGEYANETSFLTSNESFSDLKASGHLKVSVVENEGICGLALLTDGLEHAAMKRFNQPNAAFLLRLIEELGRSSTDEFRQSLHTYLSTSQKLQELTDDDKTLVLALNTQNPPELKLETYPSSLTSEPERTPTKLSSGQPKIIPVTTAEMRKG